jgi:beta-lactam-binding protein with PASTA domain
MTVVSVAINRPSRQWLLYAAVALALIVAVVALVLAITRSAPSTPVAKTHPTVRVPVVVGLTATRAERLLTADGLVVRIERAFSRNFPKGQVVAESPGAGARLAHAGLVTLLVSAGPRR